MEDTVLKNKAKIKDLEKQVGDIVETIEDDTQIDSVTPYYTVDWYIKWIASVFILISMSIRGVPGLAMYDLTFSILGVGLWTIVAFIWNDRALIVVNLVGLGFLLRTMIGNFI